MLGMRTEFCVLESCRFELSNDNRKVGIRSFDKG